jgi:fluoride exporter
MEFAITALSEADDSYLGRSESMLETFFFISIGAILGANLRYGVSQLAVKWFQSNLPYGTALINISGSFLLAFFLVWTTERVLADPRWRLFVAVGFCGGYTTYSSYAYETFALFEQGQWLFAALNVLLTNVLCLAAAIAGAALARLL